MVAGPVHAVTNFIIALPAIRVDFLQINQRLDIRDHNSPVTMVITEKRPEAEQSLRRGVDVNMMANSYLSPEVILSLYLRNNFGISFIFNLNSENLHVYIRNKQDD